MNNNKEKYEFIVKMMGNQYDPKSFKLIFDYMDTFESHEDKVRREYKEGKISQNEAFLELL